MTKALRTFAIGLALASTPTFGASCAEEDLVGVAYYMRQAGSGSTAFDSAFTNSNLIVLTESDTTSCGAGRGCPHDWYGFPQDSLLNVATPLEDERTFSYGLGLTTFSDNASGDDYTYVTYAYTTDPGLHALRRLEYDIVGAAESYDHKAGGTFGNPAYYLQVYGEYGDAIATNINDVEFRFPRGVTTAVRGAGPSRVHDVVVADTDNHRIQVFQVTENGVGKGSLGLQPLVVNAARVNGSCTLTNVAQSNLFGERKDYRNSIYPLLSYLNGASPCDLNGASVGIAELGQAEFYYPHDVAIWWVDQTPTSPDGDPLNDRLYLFVTDTHNHRVQVFRTANPADGSPWTMNFVRMWGGYGSGLAQFKYPKGIAVSVPGDCGIVGTPEPCTFDGATASTTGTEFRIYVADSGNDRIQWFDWDITTDQVTRSGEITEYTRIDPLGGATPVDLRLSHPVDVDVSQVSPPSQVWILQPSADQTAAFKANMLLKCTHGGGVSQDCAVAAESHLDTLTISPTTWLPHSIDVVTAQNRKPGATCP